MIDEKYNDLVLEYLEGSLNREKLDRFRRLISDGEIDVNELHEMEMLYNRMESADEPDPGPALKSRFYTMLEREMLEREIQNERRSAFEQLVGWFRRQDSSYGLKISYSAGIFLVGVLFGVLFTQDSSRDEQIDNLTSEVSEVREMMMITLLENSSPFDRLKAVNISQEISTADDRVIGALLQTLNNDTNVNVRIAAVNALVGHGTNPLARSGLIESIAGQSSPGVQITLADAMLALQERQSVGEFEKLLERNGLDDNVRYKIENTIVALL